MVPSILSLLLLFLTESEAFCCIQSMVQVSKLYLTSNKEEDNIDLKGMRWYFTLEPKDFLRLCDGFFEGIQAKDQEFKGILKHFTKQEFPFMKLFGDWTTSLFLGHLPLAVIIEF